MSLLMDNRGKGKGRKNEEKEKNGDCWILSMVVYGIE